MVNVLRSGGWLGGMRAIKKVEETVVKVNKGRFVETGLTRGRCSFQRRLCGIV